MLSVSEVASFPTAGRLNIPRAAFFCFLFRAAAFLSMLISHYPAYQDHNSKIEVLNITRVGGQWLLTNDVKRPLVAPPNEPPHPSSHC